MVFMVCLLLNECAYSFKLVSICNFAKVMCINNDNNSKKIINFAQRINEYLKSDWISFTFIKI